MGAHLATADTCLTYVKHISVRALPVDALFFELGYFLALTQPLKNRHNQNSFSEKLNTTSKRVPLAITTLDTNAAICSCVWGCAQQKSTFAGQNLQNAVLATTSITAIFLTNRSNSCPSGFKFRVEFRYAFGNEKYKHQFVKDERIHPPACHVWNTSKPGIHALCHSHYHSMPFPTFRQQPPCNWWQVCGWHHDHGFEKSSEYFEVLQYSGTTVSGNRIKNTYLQQYYSILHIQYCILLCLSQNTFKSGRTQMAKGGYPKLKPCSDVGDKMPSKFIGCVPKKRCVYAKK